MELGTSILPLIGGYFFITHFHPTKYHVQRQTGYHIFFHSAIAGCFLVFVSYALSTAFESQNPQVVQEWKRFAPFPYVGTAIGAFVMGMTAWWPLNVLFVESKEISRAIESDDDYLEKLFESAIQELQMVSITLESGKVYIGYVQGNYLPSGDRKYAKVLPYLSGYRASDTREMKFTNNYAAAYSKLAEQDIDLDEEDFGVVIPIERIESVRLFDPEAYELFQSAGSGATVS